MRIKLRLYSRDLDLIALKHVPNFRLGKAIRTALVEYVETGMVNRIFVELPTTFPTLPVNDQIDISFTGEEQERVAEWIKNLKPGLRSFAVKTVIRAAIGNPILAMYAMDETIALQPAEKSDSNVSQNSVQSKIVSTPNTETPVDNRGKDGLANEKSEEPIETDPSDSDEELDLFEFDDFDNI